jgi:ribonuclease HII
VSQRSLKTIRLSSPLIDENEWRRLKSLTVFEQNARQQGFKCIAGIDEAGRGPLAGPVVAAACIIPDDLLIIGIDDSKQLLPKKRQEIYQQIILDPRIIYSVGLIEVEEIDRINILQATIQAMLLAVSGLLKRPDILLVDGLFLPHPEIPSQKIIRGDAQSQSIAAASIVAKETRDRVMREYHTKWPHYGFDQHKGYGTEKHLSALVEHGPCPIHRMTFEPLKSRMQGFNSIENQVHE